MLIEEELEKKGYTVILTREGADGTVDPEDWCKDEDMQLRKKMIYESGCDMFISIHQNSYVDMSCKGPQVFYSDSKDENVVLAELIQNKLNEISPFENKRTEQMNNDYFVLKGNLIPSVIIECGFMTNTEELKLLMDPVYRKKLATGIAESVCKYWDNREKK